MVVINMCVESNTPFFIVGSGRSGSTLLRLMLSAHSRVVIPPETYFIAPLIDQLPVNKVLDEEQVTRAVDVITTHYRWPDMAMTNDCLIERTASINEPSLRDILNIIYDHHLKKENKIIWGDKTPAYIAIVPRLLELYPGAKVIHLIRDGRDVTKSFQATGWYGPWLYKNTGEWREAIQYGRQYAEVNPEISIYGVKYEDLVLNTEETVIGICKYLNIEYEQTMLDWGGTMEGKVPEREAHIHKKLARQPEMADIFRWRTEMSKRELLIVESFIYRELGYAGYSLYYSSRHWVIVFYFCRIYCAVMLPVYDVANRLLGYMRKKLGMRQ